MSRTMSILLGLGLTGLALVGCSKNNIAGPSVVLDGEESTRIDQPALIDGRLVLNRPAVNDESAGGGERSAAEESERLAEVEQIELQLDRSAMQIEGRPVAAPAEGYLILDDRPMPVPAGGGWLFIEGRPAALPTGEKIVLEGRPAVVPSGDKVILEGRAMTAPDRMVLEDPNY